jgi:hypothetical protein
MKTVVFFGFIVLLPLVVQSQRLHPQSFTKYTLQQDRPDWRIQMFADVHHREHPGFARWFCALGDVNGDGYDDFAVSSAFDTTFVFFGGDPFPHEPALILPGGRTGIASADFNGDGRLDIATAIDWINPEYNADYRGRVRVFFHKEQIPFFGPDPDMELRGPDSSGWGCFDLATEHRSAIQILDFNGDGFSDVLLKAFDRSVPTKAKLVLLYGGPVLDGQSDLEFSGLERGDGAHHFAEDVLTGDLDGNGCDDILVYGYYFSGSGSNRLKHYWDYFPGNDQGETFRTRTLHSDSGWSPADQFAKIMDVNHDGYDDIIDQAVHRRYGDVLLFLGMDELPLHPRPNDSIPNIVPTIGGDVQPRVISPVGDMNGDGTKDLMVGWATYWYPTGTLYYLYPIHPWGLTEMPTGSFGTIPDEDWVDPGAYDAGDVNGDGFDDVVVLGGGRAVPSCIDCRFQIYLGAKQMQTGVKEPPLASGTAFDVYPNPLTASHGRCTLRIREGMQGAAVIVLRNTLGKTVLRQELALTGQELDVRVQLPVLPSGYYYLNLHTGTDVQGKGIVLD